MCHRKTETKEDLFDTQLFWSETRTCRSIQHNYSGLKQELVEVYNTTILV